jgi:hypothetical protein
VKLAEVGLGLLAGWVRLRDRHVDRDQTQLDTAAGDVACALPD